MNSILYWSLILSSILVANSFDASVAYDRPLHATILGLGVVGVALVLAGHFFPALFTVAQDSQKYDAVPLDELPEVDTPRPQRSKLLSRQTKISPQLGRLVLLGAILAAIVRVEILRRVAKFSQCSSGGTEVLLIPLLISIYDAFREQTTSSYEIVDELDLSVYDVALAKFHNGLIAQRWRNIPAVVFLLWGAYDILGLWSGINSTSICSQYLGHNSLIPALQMIGRVLDVCMIISIYELFLTFEPSNPLTKSRNPFIFGSIQMLCALVWIIIALVITIFNTDLRQWILLLDIPSLYNYMFSFLEQALLLVTLCISLLHCTTHLGILEIVMTLTTIFVTIPALKFVWGGRQPFPPVEGRAAFFAFLLMYTGVWLFHSTKAAATGQRSASNLRQVLFFCLFIIIMIPGLLRKTTISFHPIDMLRHVAALEHTTFINSATFSRSFSEACHEYQHRYYRPPPPDFDVWYNYAVNRSSIVIDHFDQIEEDLLPFRTLEPGSLRRATWEMVSNPWNEISGITIRSGEAKVQDNVLPTHRWMLEGVAILINAFAKYLPDMDLAFNLNDESRIAIPFNDLEHLSTAAKKTDLSAEIQTWSADRADGWLPIPEQEYRDTVFKLFSFEETFTNWGSASCPASSPARRRLATAQTSLLCTSCTSPHSMGQFLSNWTIAADQCHQPDLAHLHGFYLSPAAAKFSHQPLPVFSQSKPRGFHDILYPSAWNYMDKAVYAPSEPSGNQGTPDYQAGHPDPSFKGKHNTLFWRGATSEGVSDGHSQWMGMTRQRFIHLTNNFTTRNTNHERVTILLPDPAPRSGRYEYQIISPSTLLDLGLSADVKVVDHIARCGGEHPRFKDCIEQEREFGVVSPSDFQDHWQYRYLVDVDGAGFSGRFIPFLQSKSLPFKAALFREWWDERVTAWKHFVPLDLRLHGLWSTLAYFAGVEGEVAGIGKVLMGAHTKEAEMIAESGRDWAGKALRKEDMEIYFFRLLLEYGRIVDDNRDKLGFICPAL